MRGLRSFWVGRKRIDHFASARVVQFFPCLMLDRASIVLQALHVPTQAIVLPAQLFCLHLQRMGFLTLMFVGGDAIVPEHHVVSHEHGQAADGDCRGLSSPAIGSRLCRGNRRAEAGFGMGRFVVAHSKGPVGSSIAVRCRKWPGHKPERYLGRYGAGILPPRSQTGRKPQDALLFLAGNDENAVRHFDRRAGCFALGVDFHGAARTKDPAKAPGSSGGEARGGQSSFTAPHSLRESRIAEGVGKDEQRFWGS